MLLWSNSVSLPTIHTPDKYYFIPQKACENNFFAISYAEVVKVNEKEICELKPGIDLVAIPREFIKNLNPVKDFTIRVTVPITTINPSCNGCTVKMTSRKSFDEVPLGNILNNTNLKYPEYLTHAILSTGNPCIDLGTDFLIISNGVSVTKFTDKDILTKLNNALNLAVWGSSHSAEFNLVNGEMCVPVTIGLSTDLKERLTGTRVGRFTL